MNSLVPMLVIIFLAVTVLFVVMMTRKALFFPENPGDYCLPKGTQSVELADALSQFKKSADCDHLDSYPNTTGIQDICKDVKKYYKLLNALTDCQCMEHSTEVTPATNDSEYQCKCNDNYVFNKKQNQCVQGEKDKQFTADSEALDKELRLVQPAPLFPGKCLSSYSFTSNTRAGVYPNPLLVTEPLIPAFRCVSYSQGSDSITFNVLLRCAIEPSEITGKTLVWNDSINKTYMGKITGFTQEDDNELFTLTVNPKTVKCDATLANRDENTQNMCALSTNVLYLM